jgi:hypothetical protein
MRWKNAVLFLVWGLAAAAWAGLAAFHATDPALKEWAIAVTIVAVATEAAFWTTAALLGLTLWESRKAVWRFLTRPLRSGN